MSTEKDNSNMEVVLHGNTNTELVSHETPKKRVKPKGDRHELHYEILDNKAIKAENGWELESEEYWNFGTCKKYIKMYHIGRLWPRECHEVHTKGFICNPRTCKDDHFLHRAEEVWVALFGDRPKTKGYFSYTLLCMVYAELILKRKVNWSTYVTNKLHPLRLGRNQKDIPDLFDPESNSTKSLLQKLRKKAREIAMVDTPPSTTTLKEDEGNLVATDGSLEEPFAVGGRRDIKSVGEPSVREVDAVHEQGGNLEDVVPELVSAHITENPVAPKRSTSVIPETTSKNVGPSNPMETTSERESVDPTCDMGMLSNFKEVLRGVPSNAKLEEFMTAIHELAKDCNDVDCEYRVDKDLFPLSKPSDIWSIAGNSKIGSKVLAAMAVDFVKMSHTFADIMPMVLQGATGFEGVVDRYHLLLKESGRDSELIVELKAKIERLEKEIGELKDELKPLRRTTKPTIDHDTRMEASLGTVHPKPIVHAEECAPTENDSQATSSTLFLSKYDGLFKENDQAMKGVGSCEPRCSEVAAEIGWSQVQLRTEDKRKAILELEVDAKSWEMKLEMANKEKERALADWENDARAWAMKLEAANKERDEALAELEAVRNTVRTVDYTPPEVSTLPWLGWVHRIQDRESMVSKAQHDLKIIAAKSRDSREVVETSLEIFKKHSEKKRYNPMEVTIWGDVDEMMERTNYFKMGKTNDVDWTLEIEEGWAPYNTFSSHLQESARNVINTCDPPPAILKAKCAMCLQYFGPEGAYTLGQCGHNFHVTCICRYAMTKSACPICRSPFSTRFYELMGIRDLMPPGHEFNRWNLPLDQLPKKFLHYSDWGNALDWDPSVSKHQLSTQYGGESDPFFWMTQDYQVEIRARSIRDDEQRELFCRNFGGHWSIEHKRFFRFPPKRVEKREDGSWHEVGDTIDLGDEYKKYDQTPIGRALVLAKLEEAAIFRTSISEDSFKDVEVNYWDAVSRFDKRIGDVIASWRKSIQDPKEESLLLIDDFDGIVKNVVARIEKAMEILRSKHVEPTKKRKRDDGEDSEGSWMSEMHREIAAVDREYEEGGRIARPSQRPRTRSVAQIDDPDEPLLAIE